VSRDIETLPVANVAVHDRTGGSSSVLDAVSATLLLDTRSMRVVGVCNFISAPAGSTCCRISAFSLAQVGFNVGAEIARIDVGVTAVAAVGRRVALTNERLVCSEDGAKLGDGHVIEEDAVAKRVWNREALLAIACLLDCL
jgi:hypothetical protein